VHAVLARMLFEKDVEILGTMLDNRNWTLNSAEFPILDVTFKGTRPLRVRLECGDWDGVPPSAELLNQDGTDLADAIPGGIFNGSAHPSTGKTFVCMRGIREYHTHPSHVQEKWDGYRGQDGMNLTGILDQLSRGWRKAVRR
jgi:hypothetical protein